MTAADPQPVRPAAVAAVYRSYVALFRSPTDALLDFAQRAGIAVAWLDREYIEIERGGTLSDPEWADIAAGLDSYDEHCCYSVDLNASFLDQLFAEAGIPRYPADDPAPPPGPDPDS